jgi:site-specific DNA-methyltransferase (adenine-specific)
MIIHGDCLEKLKTLEDNSVDSVVTDPPYGLSFMGKKWDYDVPSEEIWRECLRVLKPGGHLLSFAGSRTYHRMAVRIEDAGFEIRDQIMWVYGSGFPKSHNIGKNIEKIKVGGIKNLKQIGTKKGIKVETGTQGFSYSKEYVAGKSMGGKQISGDIPVYEINNEWEGWGTALKPAHEPIVVARKPLGEKTVAENCLKWGVGGINIDGCRVEAPKGDKFGGGGLNSPVNGFMGNTENTYKKGTGFRDDTTLGRFPANLIHDGSDEVVGLFPNTKSGAKKANQENYNHTGKEFVATLGASVNEYQSSEGSAARFFYCAKASKSERNMGCERFEKRKADTRTPVAAGLYEKMSAPHHNFHPTVKPIALMEYLIKLVSREGHTILDPFMGSGTTGIACKNLNRQFIGIEREEDYVKIANARINAKV